MRRFLWRCTCSATFETLLLALFPHINLGRGR